MDICIKKVLVIVFFAVILPYRLLANVPLPAKDTLATILQMDRYELKERMLVGYLKPRFQNAPLKSLVQLSYKTDIALNKYHTENPAAYKYFIQSLCRVRYNKLDEAEASIQKAIAQLNATPDRFLKFSFYRYWGNIRALRGNGIGAIYCYWIAKKESIVLNDPHAEAVLDIDISGLYYIGSAYNQSLFYLNHALIVINKYKLDEPYLLTLIYYSKAENFFRLNNADSLKVYNLKLKSPKNITYKIQTFRIRTDYYLQLLAHNYAGAINTIKSMMGGNKLYLYSQLDKQHLADAYFMNNQPDSAKQVINSLLKGPLESDNPEIKLRLYQTLAAMAKTEKNDTAEARYNVLALKESQNYICRLTQIDNMSAQMQMDEISASYQQSTRSYQTRNIIMLSGLIITALAGGLIFLFYRNLKQKQRYESLLYLEQKNELSFINSHKVRKYLCNILGLISTIKQSDEPAETFFESQEHLYNSAQQLDDAIKSIAEKLDA